jgi:hypothetical protein
MSVAFADLAPPLPGVIPEEEYGLDPSLAYSDASESALRGARKYQEDPTLMLALLLVSTEVEIARARNDAQYALEEVRIAALKRKQWFVEQYPAMLISERAIASDQVELASTIAVRALFKLRETPNERFDILDFFKENLKTEAYSTAFAA